MPWVLLVLKGDCSDTVDRIWYIWRLGFSVCGADGKNWDLLDGSPRHNPWIWLFLQFLASPVSRKIFPGHIFTHQLWGLDFPAEMGQLKTDQDKSKSHKFLHSPRVLKTSGEETCRKSFTVKQVAWHNKTIKASIPAVYFLYMWSVRSQGAVQSCLKG